MTEKMKKAFIVRNFKDAGTEKKFTAGATVDLPEGVFRNYEAAGLVRRPNAEEKPKDEPSASTDSRTRVRSRSESPARPRRETKWVPPPRRGRPPPSSTASQPQSGRRAVVGKRGAVRVELGGGR